MKKLNTKRTTWPEVAAALGVTRTTITEWRKMEDAPKVPDVSAWQIFKEAKQLGSSPTNIPKGREALLEEKLRREIALLDIKVASARREVIPAVEIDELLSEIATQQRAEMIQFAETEAATVAAQAGMEIAEIRPILRGVVDRQCKAMEDGVTRYMARMAKEEQ
jgi:transcriptional regulator with XRE-family HTH domain